MWGGIRSEARLAGAGTPFEWYQANGYGRQPFANVVSGPWQLTAGPNGVQLGIFGWADPNTGEVSNQYIPGGALGFVLPVRQMWNWQRAYPQCTPPYPPGIILRPGMQCVLAAIGDFLTRFPLGGEAGNQVWTDPNTGQPYAASAGENLSTDSGLIIVTQGGNPISTQSGGFVATPWTLMQNGGCNSKLRISSFVKPVT
jgi:hypothetical protein